MLPRKALFLIALAFVQLAFPIDLGTEGQLLSFARMALPANSSISAEAFAYNNSTAYAVSSSGQIRFVLMHSLSGNVVPLSNPSEIKSALYSYYFSRGSQPISLSDFESVHSSILSLREKYKKGEDACRVLVGTDRHACNDFYSCQQACYSVTSFCLPVALGSDRQFINIIWDFENDSRSLDEAYAGEEKAYAALSQNTTRGNVESYLRSLETVNREATDASLSPLYDAYSYCFVPVYSLPDITNVQLSAQKHYERAQPLFSLQALADAIEIRTREALAKKSIVNGTGASAAAEAAEAAKKAELAAKEAADAQLKAAEEQKKSNGTDALLPVIAAVLIVAGAAAYYFLIHKKKKRGL